MTSRVCDGRAAEALELLLRLPDGRWRAGGRRWIPMGNARLAEVADWGRKGPNEMITLNALRVLRVAGRFTA